MSYVIVKPDLRVRIPHLEIKVPVNAIVLSEYVRVVERRALRNLRLSFPGIIDTVFAIRNTVFDIEVAEMPLTALNRVAKDVILTSHVNCGDAVGLAARVLVPRAIMSRFTTSERIVVKVSRTSIVALLWKIRKR